MQYLTDDCRCPIVEWYGTQDPDVQAAFDVLVKELSATEDWDAPKQSKRKYRVLTRTHAGLCELIFKVDKRKFRPLGILQPELKTFILLTACEHQRGSNIPEDAFDEALKFRRLFEEGRGVTREHI